MTTPTPRERLGTRIRTERERLGWTQARLAEEVTAASGGEVTLARSTLARQEAGEREPSVLEGVYIAQALGVSLEALITPDDDDLLARAKQLVNEHSDAAALLDSLAAQHNLTVARMREVEAQVEVLLVECQRRIAAGGKVSKAVVNTLQSSLDEWRRPF
jgi:transcriptional regulator with XRE-family HTH domain